MGQDSDVTVNFVTSIGSGHRPDLRCPAHRLALLSRGKVV
jgi:hypothetical protein